MRSKRTASQGTTWKLSIGALAVVGSLVLGAWLTTPSAAAQRDTLTGPVAQQPAAGAPHPGAAQTGGPPPSASGARTAPAGLPAIAPSASQMKTGGPAITKGAVIAYVQTHAMPRMSAPAQPFVVTRAELLRSDVITTLLNGESVGAPDDQLLWYVEVNGTFSGGGSPNTPPVTFHHGTWVFDPVTGNLLLCGSRP